MRGNIFDHALLLFAFVEAYNVFGESIYLETAKSIADMSLEMLYDPWAGGFFERHSPDVEKYAEGEAIDFTKPSVENGIMSLALAKLYEYTKNKHYLEASITSLGASLSR